MRTNGRNSLRRSLSKARPTRSGKRLRTSTTTKWTRSSMTPHRTPRQNRTIQTTRSPRTRCHTATRRTNSCSLPVRASGHRTMKRYYAQSLPTVPRGNKPEDPQLWRSARASPAQGQELSARSRPGRIWCVWPRHGGYQGAQSRRGTRGRPPCA